MQIRKIKWALLTCTIIIESCNYQVKKTNLNDGEASNKSDSVFIKRVLKNVYSKKYVYSGTICDCPDWIEYEYFVDGKYEASKLDTVPKKHKAYIESVRSDSILAYDGIRIYDIYEFFGEKDSILRTSADRQYVVEDVPQSTVFLYSSFRKIGQLKNNQ